MASPVPAAPEAPVSVAPPVQSGGGDPQSPLSATEAFARMSQAGEASPATPEATPDVPVTPEQAQSASPATGQPTSPALTPEAQEAKWLLDKFGGDINAAAKWAVETNNRAAALAAKLKESGVDPSTVAPGQTLEPQTTAQAPPAPAVQAPPEQLPPVEIPAQQIEETVRQVLARDTEADQLVSQYANVKADAQRIGAQLNDITNKIKQAEFRLTIPEIATDSFKKDEVERELSSLLAQEARLDRQAQRLENEQLNLSKRYTAKAESYREAVRRDLTARETERLEQARYEQAVSYHEQQFAQAWPVALNQAIQAHSIPPQLAEAFKREAKTYARAYDGAIEDIPGFVSGVAKSFMETADAFHRFKSGEYAKQATTRASIPGPTGTAAVAPPNQTPVPETLNDISRSTLQRLKDNARAILGR